MKNSMILIAAVLLITAGTFGLTLEINTKFHYFGTGTVFGIGLTLLGMVIFSRIKKRINR